MQSQFLGDQTVERKTCSHEDCDGVVEANPSLYMSLYADGHWEIDGVADEAARIVCDDHEHDNTTEADHLALTAFLEQEMPGTTWQGSDPNPNRGAGRFLYQVEMGQSAGDGEGVNTMTAEVASHDASHAVADTIARAIREMALDLSRPFMVTVTGGDPLDAHQL